MGNVKSYFHDEIEEMINDTKHDEYDVWASQVSGDHYRSLAIQPMEYSLANGLDAAQHTVIKYITRFREKGRLDDLEKAKHAIDLLIDYEYGEEEITFDPGSVIYTEPGVQEQEEVQQKEASAYGLYRGVVEDDGFITVWSNGVDTR
jgi:hypothetical protein